MMTLFTSPHAPYVPVQGETSPPPPWQHQLFALNRKLDALGTERIHQALALLGNPHQRLKVIHLGGTNGKGSVGAMLVSVLQAQGYRVGHTLSPHLCHVTERIQLNGHPLAPEAWATAFAEVSEVLTKAYGQAPSPQWPSFFEMVILLACHVFAQQQVDVAVFEVGLGGRLDATNVFDNALVSVITSIGYDHMAILGDTLEAIAGEKAGIFRPNVPVVLGPNLPDEARDVLRAKAQAQQAFPLLEAQSDCLHWVTHPPDADGWCGAGLRNLVSNENLTLGLAGAYQKPNVATVLATTAVLNQRGLRVSPSAVAQGLASAHWPGRFQRLSLPYLPKTTLNVVLDGAHNADGWQALAHSLEQHLPHVGLHWLVASKANKPLQAMVDTLEHLAERTHSLTCVSPSQGQSDSQQLFMPAGHLRQHLRNACPSLATKPIWAADSVASGVWCWQRWQANAGEGAWGVAAGSLYLMGELLTLLSP
jgi:dihydrofolate synthase/folylpolyglutamate synthase